MRMPLRHRLNVSWTNSVGTFPPQPQAAAATVRKPREERERSYAMISFVFFYSLLVLRHFYSRAEIMRALASARTVAECLRAVKMLKLEPSENNGYPMRMKFEFVDRERTMHRFADLVKNMWKAFRSKDEIVQSYLLNLVISGSGMGKTRFGMEALKELRSGSCCW